jgi:hypothetical protein
MTPEYILRKSLCRPAHCYSAREEGKGYTNRGDNPATKAEYDRQRRRTADSAIDNLQYAQDYAEPGYRTPKKGILFADWNIFPRGLDDILERYGYDVQWEDEWMTCGGCGKAVRSQGNSYHWQPSYAILHECELYCVECLQDDPEEHLKGLEDNPRTCNTIRAIDPEDYGYIKVNTDAYETGWHAGQNDDPKKVYEGLKAKGYQGIVFSLDENSQFYSKWSVYYRPAEETSEEEED